MTCEHLYPLEKELKEANVKETSRGAAWGDGTREWVYFDAVLDIDSIQSRMNFPDIVEVHENLDERSGTERGFFCTKCRDAIMGTISGNVKFG